MKRLWMIGLLLTAVFLAACSSNAATVDSGASAAAVAETAVSGAKLNLNTVSGDELLATIPGFGSRMVREFQEYRPYVSIEQFRREIGKYVDDAQVATYEQYVFVPVDVDGSDAATLMQLPGVDAGIAEQLVGERPFGSNDAFLTKLGELVSSEDAALAEGYLVVK
ncbi:MAG: hypothetical protein KDE56_22300 [Anaerolineales bacterium]|nr:hypothetical protein [Anaerolineales bacterium]